MWLGDRSGKGKGGRMGNIKRDYFVTPQHCKTCNKNVSHIPKDCPELPENKKKRAEYLAREAVKAAETCKGGN